MNSETLATILFFVIAFAWSVYLVQEIFILGASALNQLVCKDEGERKQVQVVSGLYFDGVEVWLIASLVLMVGTFPLAFGTTLTYLYVVFFLLLYALIARGVSIEVIYKLDSRKWVKSMVVTWTVSSILIAFFLGVYLTSVFYGFPLEQDGSLGSFLSIFNTTGIAGGFLFVILSLLAGAAWIKLTTEGELGDRALTFVKKYGVIFLSPIVLLLTFMGFNNTDASIFIGRLFSASPVWFVLPALTVLASLASIYAGAKKDAKLLLLFTLGTLFFFLLTGFVGTFPYLVPSRIDPSFGISALDTDVMVSAKSMTIIVIAVAIFFPTVLGYQGWKYKKFIKKVTYNDE